MQEVNIFNTTIIHVKNASDIKRFQAREEINDHQAARRIALRYTDNEEAKRIVDRIGELEFGTTVKQEDERQALIVEFYNKFTIVLTTRELAL